MLWVAVPGHHVFNNLQPLPELVWFHLVPKLKSGTPGFVSHRTLKTPCRIPCCPACVLGRGESSKAAIYTRVSTTDQNPEMQIRELKEYATNHGWEILEIYEDTISGSKLSRPALNRPNG